MIPLVLTLAAIAEDVAPGTAADINADMTLIFQIGERELGAEDNWTLRNSSSRTIPAEAIVIPMALGARNLRLADGSEGSFEAAADSSRIVAKGSLGQEERSVASKHFLPFSGATLVVHRRL